MTNQANEPKADPSVLDSPTTPRFRVTLSGPFLFAVLVIISLAVYLIIRENRPGGALSGKSADGLSQPSIPSLLVLPFQTDGAKRTLAVLALGLTDDLKRRLTRESGLALITCPKMPNNRSDLLPPVPGTILQSLVPYVLRGTIQPAPAPPQLEVELVDGSTEKRLWHDRYTISYPALYTIKEDIVGHVLHAMSVHPNPIAGEQKASTIPLEKSWRVTVKGKHPPHAGPAFGPEYQLSVFQQAVQFDTGYAEAWRMLSWTHYQSALGAMAAQQPHMDKALRCADTAIALDRQSSGALALRAAVLLWQRQYGQADEAIVRAVTAGPGDAFAHLLQARIQYALGRYDAAVASARKAQFLNPCESEPPLMVSARAQRMQGALTNAWGLYTGIIKKKQNQNIPLWQVHLDLVELSLENNDLAAARAHLKQALRLKRDLSVQQLPRVYWYDNPQQLRERRAHLRHAGLPETSPPELHLEPTIVVLPFTAVGADKQDESFIEGLGDYLTELLSRSKSMMVVSFNAGKALHHTTLDGNDMALQLGANFVLEIQVRHAADSRLSIEAAFRNPAQAITLWKVSLSGAAAQIPQLLQRVVRKIIDTATFWPVRKPRGKADACFGEDTAAFTYLLKGRLMLRDRTREGLFAARRWADALLQVAPDCSDGYRLKARSYLEAVWFGLSPEPQSVLDKGAKLARHILEMADAGPFDHALLGVIYLLQHRHDRSLAAGRKALELGPHDAQTFFHTGTIFRFVREYEKALFTLERAVRLDPVTPPHYLNGLGWTYLLAEQPEKALAVFDRILARNPDYLFADLGRVAAHFLAGRHGLAQYQAARIQERFPDFRLMEWARSEPYQHPEDFEPIVTALSRSGLR